MSELCVPQLSRPARAIARWGERVVDAWSLDRTPWDAMGAMASRVTLSDMSTGNGAWPRVVGGTLAVALVLGASRWGTYIGIAPVYATDVLVAGAVWASVMGALAQQRLRP